MQTKKLTVGLLGLTLFLLAALLTVPTVTKILRTNAEVDRPTDLVISVAPNQGVAQAFNVTLTPNVSYQAIELPLPKGVVYTPNTQNSTDPLIDFDFKRNTIQIKNRVAGNRKPIVVQLTGQMPGGYHLYGTLTQADGAVSQSNTADLMVRSDFEKAESTAAQRNVAQDQGGEGRTNLNASLDQVVNQTSQDFPKVTPKSPLITTVGERINAIPEPPESGPPINQADSFTNTGYSPVQEAEYQNMRIVADGNESKMSTMWYNNVLDATRPYEAKFYIYMGKVDGKQVGDGVTYTMQSDPRGTQAVGQPGEGLGVYGTFNQSQYTGQVENALSVEFDPFYNFDYSDRDVQSMRKGHMAITQGEVKPTLYNNRRGWILTHHNPVVLPIEDFVQSKWVPVTIKWVPVVPNHAQIFVSFGSHSLSPYTLSLGVFGGSTKPHWGFTASTGAATMQMAVAYTQIPQRPTMLKQVRNVTQGGEFAEDAEAKPGDELQYKFILTNSRSNGIGNNWENVKIHDTLPAGVVLKDGNRVIDDYIGGTNTVQPDAVVEKTYDVVVQDTVPDKTKINNIAQSVGVNAGTKEQIEVTSNISTVTMKKPIDLKVDATVQVRNLTAGGDFAKEVIAKTGDDLEYLIKVANRSKDLGLNDLHSAKLAVGLSEGVAFQGTSPDHFSQTLGEVLAGGSNAQEYRFVQKAKTTATTGISSHATGSVTGTDSAGQPREFKFEPATVIINPVPLKILLKARASIMNLTDSAQGYQSTVNAKVGDQLIYRFEIQNASQADPVNLISKLHLKVNLPDGINWRKETSPTVDVAMSDLPAAGTNNYVTVYKRAMVTTDARLNHETKGIFSGTDTKDNSHTVETNPVKVILNRGKSGISLSVRNISFGEIDVQNREAAIKQQVGVSATTPIITIKDTRDKQTGLKLSLTQKKPFTLVDNPSVISRLTRLIFMSFDGNGSIPLSIGVTANIMQVPQGEDYQDRLIEQPFPDGKGLQLIKLPGELPKLGRYQTTLEWTLTDAP